MFTDCSVMAILNDIKAGIEIQRLEMDAATQSVVCSSFSSASVALVSNKEEIPFEGDYIPEDNQYLAIKNFALSEAIEKAIKNPLNVKAYRPIKKQFPQIKALFVGKCVQENKKDSFIVAFQKFHPNQYIAINRLNLMFDKDSFFQEKRTGISISPFIDCLLNSSGLLFSSFHYAKQIFDLSDYYREATQAEILTFSSAKKLRVEDSETFNQQAADRWIRRRVAIINDSKVLERFSAAQIKQLGKGAGVNIAIAKGKIVVPIEKTEMKKLIGFLAEEVYPGYFSDNTTYMANSKRKI